MEISWFTAEVDVLSHLSPDIFLTNAVYFFDGSLINADLVVPAVRYQRPVCCQTEEPFQLWGHLFQFVPLEIPADQIADFLTKGRDSGE